MQVSSVVILETVSLISEATERGLVNHFPVHVTRGHCNGLLRLVTYADVRYKVLKLWGKEGF
jgi:hypothetical protein